MKIILLISICFISGCATVQPMAPVNTINAPDANVMLHCAKKTGLIDGKFGTVTAKLVEYAKIIDECDELNESKINYINKELIK